MHRRTRLLAVLAPLAAALASPCASPALADPPTAAWEQTVERETAEQTALIQAARARKAMAGVVTRYASRVSREPSALNRYLLGRALYYNDDPVGAKTQMALALEADPGFYFAHLRLAILLTDLKNYAEAEAHLREVLKVRPSDPDALEQMTRIAVEQKDWARALRLLAAQLDKDPSDERARFLLARVHMERKDWEAAIREWRLLKARDPSRPEVRYFLADALAQKGELDAAAAELEALAREQVDSRMAPEILDRLRAVYVKKKDWERVRTTIERMLPYLPEDQRKAATAQIEALKAGPPAEAPAEGAPVPTSWEEVYAAAQGPDRALRERALRSVYEAAGVGVLKQVPGVILKRVTEDVEPDPACRAWVVRLLGTLAPTVLPLVSLALYDPDATVRMLASETLGDMGQPAAILYLLPFTEIGGLDVVEYESIRAALSKLTGFSDLPPGLTAVLTSADVDASREAWRRWRLSDESARTKLEAMRQLGTVRESAPERFLYDLVLDKTFPVMREAYLAMRQAVAREPRDPVEKKVFPHFPQVADAEVTRASMRTVQDRVKAWWEEWVAERRAYLKAKGAPTAPGK